MFKQRSSALVLFLFCAALVLAVWTVLTTSVTYLDSSDWGLLTRLPLTYWIGIATIGIVILLSSLRGFLNTRISLVLLVLIFLYVHFIPMIIEKPVGLSVFSLWPSSEANQVVATGQISIGTPRMLMDYSSWPFFTIFNSIFMIITGFPLISIAKWFPAFTLSFWGLLTFLILRKFLRLEYALIGFALFLSTSWTRQQYFGPQSFAFSLFLLFVFMITKNPRYGFGTYRRSFFGLVFVTFLATLFSHALTSLIILMILLSSYVAAILFAKSEEKESKSNLILVLSSFFALISYNVCVSPQFFDNAINEVLSTLSNFGTPKTVQQFSRLPGSQVQQLTNISTILIIVGLVAVSLVALLQMIRKKTIPKIQLTFWISYLFVLLVVAFMPYGAEGPFRAYIFGLPILCLLSVCLLKRKPLFLGCFILLTLVLCIPALYGPDSTKLAPAPELIGSKFCATYLPADIHLFYRLSPYVRYYDPVKHITFIFLGQPPFVNYDATSVEGTLNDSDFVVLSRSQLNYYEYYLGIDPFDKIDLIGKPEIANGLIYNNGNFTVYDSRVP